MGSSTKLELVTALTGTVISDDNAAEVPTWRRAAIIVPQLDFEYTAKALCKPATQHLSFNNHSVGNQHAGEAKARFPLLELTGDRFPLPVMVLTGARFH